MKPSEYLFNEAINSVENRKKDFYLGLLEYNEFGEDISTYIFNRRQEKELDKRFIDKEELKDKINKLEKYNIITEVFIEGIDKKFFVPKTKEAIILEEILELIK